LRDRIRLHKRSLDHGEHHNAHLQSAWRKYGPEAFQFRVLLLCAKNDLYFYEQRCLDAFDVISKGYNKSPTAGTVLGIKRTPEYVQKMAASKRGKKQSPETIAIRRAAMNRPEVRAKLSVSCKAAIRKPKTPEHIRKVAEALRGRVVSPETREKIRAFNLGRKRGPYVIHQATRSHKGRPFTAEHRANIALAQKRSTRTTEQRRLSGLKSAATRK